MLFGLSNTPATVKRLMELHVHVVLSELIWKICLIYLDTVIVNEGNFHDALDRLKQVWQRIHEAH